MIARRLGRRDNPCARGDLGARWSSEPYLSRTGSRRLSPIPGMTGPLTYLRLGSVLGHGRCGALLLLAALVTPNLESAHCAQTWARLALAAALFTRLGAPPLTPEHPMSRAAGCGFGVAGVARAPA